mmetsp:Transcript_21756/g.54208  ORF Transcript_21756/g.54208 Transcript_21756/m.54208 type:complete len:434 (+) Transcript_21756:44-1345(+)
MWPLLVLAATRRVLLYVDPCAERLHVLPACERRGVDVVRLHSPPAASAILQGAADEETVLRVRASTAPPAGKEREWAASQLPPGTTVCGVLCGSDGGLATAERLQHVLAPSRSNGVLPARRDKFEMNEVLRSRGLAALAQCAPSEWDDAARFLRQHGYPVVVKPRRGQASVLVGVAESEHQAHHMFEIVRKATVSLDNTEAASGCVVVQELLVGSEWVVDTVSASGEHKCVALWKYDKGAANGAPFVYFCDELRPCSGEQEAALISFAFAALDALEWRWGPCHIEIMMTVDGPRLVEVNAGRWNGVDFQGLVSICTGYDAYEATLDAYLDNEAWEHVASTPPAELLGAARLVKLVSSVEGELMELQHTQQLDALPSLIRFEPEPSQIGENVSLTVDLATCAGYAYLLHGDPTVVAEDYATIRKLQPTLFSVRT